MENVGEVSGIVKLSYLNVINWKIRKIILLSKTIDKAYYSPSFSFADARWCLCIWPNRKTSQSSECFIGLYLIRLTPGLPICLEFSLGLRTRFQTINPNITNIHEFKEVNEENGCSQLLSRQEFLERKREFAPASVLSVICSLDNSKPLRETNKVQLLDDFKALMLSGDHSDVIVKVKGEEFSLHRNILAFRNPFFRSMFGSEVKEKMSDIVSIDDCEPDLFRSFIQFLYTGKVGKLSHGNVCGLYQVSQKYQAELLKNECFNFMINTLTVDTVCDIAELSLRHSDGILLGKVVEFFASCSHEIMQTVKWQLFLTEHPIEGNDIRVRALEHIRDH